MGEIVKFYPAGAAKNPDAVLEQAIGVYTDVLILGWNKDGYLDPRASLDMKASDMLWLIEQFKYRLLSGGYDETEEEEE